MKNDVAALFRIVLLERRIPGRVYGAYYDLLRRCGRTTHTIRPGRGVTLRGTTDALAMAQEVWSKRVYDHSGFQLNERSVVIDVGANQGFFSTYAASFGATVYAFEPSTENFGFLQSNVARNGMGGRVHAVRAAVAGTEGQVELYVGLDRRGEPMSGTASITNRDRGGVAVRQERVRSTTLDAIFRQHGIGFCDLLKMDCEGAEYEILESASADCFARIGRISMETHAGRGREAVRILEAHGFEVVEFDDREAGTLKARRWTQE